MLEGEAQTVVAMLRGQTDPEESLKNLKPPGVCCCCADAGIPRGTSWAWEAQVMPLYDARKTVCYGAESTVLRSSLSILPTVLVTVWGGSVSWYVRG